MDLRIGVLDKGYVRLVDKLGSDVTVVNSARVSYDKSVKSMSLKDERLVKYLAEHDHTSPFRHAAVQFEVYAPLMVARQWWKYCIGSNHQEDSFAAWNESSRRYVTEDPVFHTPGSAEWRSAPNSSKQGSGDNLPDEVGLRYSQLLDQHQEDGQRYYEEAIKAGVCAEQARLFLAGYGLYVRWYWTASLQAVSHFLRQRLKDDAQKEIRYYALAVEELTLTEFPVSLSALLA